MRTNMLSELVKDFMSEYGITKEAAENAVELFFDALYDQIKASPELEKAVQAAFMGALQRAFIAGEAWATDVLRASMAKVQEQAQAS
ncbi:hypothetical protein ABZ752_22775 [Streptomyces roseifaciens]